MNDQQMMPNYGAALGGGGGLSPYLNIDPSIFKNTEPQYIMPEGASHQGRGHLELAFGQIGLGVVAGYAWGSAVGLVRSFGDDTIKRVNFGSPVYRTQMINFHVKHAPAAARPVGCIMLGYSVVNIIIGKSRGVDDALNNIGAGVVSGFLYRSPTSFTARSALPSLKSGGIGGGIALLASLMLGDSRQQLMSMAGL